MSEELLEGLLGRVSEPKASALDGRPDHQALFDKLRGLADAIGDTWTVPSGDPIYVATREESGGDSTQPSDIRGYLLHVLTAGKDAPSPTVVAANRTVVLDVMRYVLTRAGRRTAEAYLTATRADPAAVSDALAAEAAQQLGPADQPDDETIPPPPPVAAAMRWSMERVGQSVFQVAGPYLSSYFLLGIVDVAKEQRARVAAQLTATTLPVLRLGTAFQRSIVKTPGHVAAARRKAQLSSLKLTPEQIELRRLYAQSTYEPLGAYEQYVIGALTTLARLQGRLDGVQWAERPLFGVPRPRVAVEYRGVSELARIAGFEPDKSGKIPRAVRTVMDAAIKNLAQQPRFIVTPVLIAPASANGRYVEDIEVTQDLWIQTSELIGAGRAFLNVHSAAFASVMRTYTEIPHLAALHQSALREIGARQMRNDLAIAEVYVRHQAMTQWGFRRRSAKKNGEAFVAGGAIAKRLRHSRLVTQFGLSGVLRDRGTSEALKRVEQCLAFCQARGVLAGFAPDNDCWVLQLPYPDGTTEDDEQIAIALPDPDDDEVAEPDREGSHL